MGYEDTDFDTNEYGGRDFHICSNARWYKPENMNLAMKQISLSPSYVRVAYTRLDRFLYHLRSLNKAHRIPKHHCLLYI